MSIACIQILMGPECGIKVEDFLYSSSPNTVSWKTTDVAGTDLLTKGEFKYGTTAALGQTSGQSNNFFVSHSKSTQITLVAGTTYFYEIESEDQAGNFCQTTGQLTTPAATAHAEAWSFTQFQPAPLGRTWEVVYDSDQGPVTESGNPKITRNQVKDGCICYRHKVNIGDDVSGSQSTSTPVCRSYAPLQKICWRFHKYADGYSGDDGKDIQAMIGHGYQGDKVGSDNRIRIWLGTYADSCNDLDSGFCCSMHPDINNTQNRTGLFATHAINVPSGLKNQPSPTANLSSLQGAYYGDTEQGSSTAYPLNQWNTIDIVLDRTTGWSLYQNGGLRAQSNESNNRALDNWDIHSALWWMTRHMHGGNSDQLLSRFNYNEWYGGFFIAVSPI